MTIRSQFKRRKDRLRSQKRQQKYDAQKQAEIDLANSIVLAYSWRDNSLVRGETVYHKDCVKVIREKIREAFKGAEPEHAFNHEFGEVLNHFK